MGPAHIPTTTGKPWLHNVHDLALCSPSERHPRLYRGRVSTVVDCLMFFLRKNPTQAYSHLRWYCDFVCDNARDETLTFVVPDVTLKLVNAVQLSELGERWAQVPVEARVLVVPGTPLAKVVRQRVVGHALQGRMSGPVHPEWTHSFSRRHTQIEGTTDRWTYDSYTPVDGENQC